MPEDDNPRDYKRRLEEHCPRSPESNSEPAWASIPADIQKRFCNSTGTTYAPSILPTSAPKTTRTMSSLFPSSSGSNGAGLFGASQPPPNTGPASGSGSLSNSGTGGLFPDPTPKEDPLAALNRGVKAAQAAREEQERANASGIGGNHGLTDTSSQQQQQPQPSGTGLFGSSQTSQPQQSGGLFGASTAQPSQPQSGGLGLFGGSTSQPQNQNATPAPNQAGGGGLGGLFGGGPSAQQNENTNTNLGSLFNTTTNNNKSIFAGAGSGLGNSSTLNQGSNMFGQKPAQPGSASSLFSSTANAGRGQPSLLGATQHSQVNQPAPFGRLSMGQSNAQANTVGAAKVDYTTLRPTTRYEDCVESVQKELEMIDQMIQKQEQFCRQIEAFMPKHEEDIKSLSPDIDFVKSKADDVEQALISDAQGIEVQRKNADKDKKDLERCERIVTNFALPQAYQYAGNMSMGGLGSMYGSQQGTQQAPSTAVGEDYDMDLIGNYFRPMAEELQKNVNAYANNLTEIENHMRVMESSAIMQSQQLAQQKSGAIGMNGPANGEDTIRELADTLRGFEQSILGVASVVGECREGVNELVLGRLGNHLGGMR